MVNGKNAAWIIVLGKVRYFVVTLIPESLPLNPRPVASFRLARCLLMVGCVGPGSIVR